MKLRDYQHDAVQSFFDYYQKGNSGNPIIVAATGCHAKGSGILMFDGTTKNVEDIIIGDLIMGDDATERKVLSLKHGYDIMYKIIPNKGEPFIVNSDHILSLQTTRRSKNHKTITGNEIVNISVNDYLKKNNHFKHLHKLYKRPIKLFKNNLLISPYIVGLMLGDGSLNYQPAITTMDFEVVNEFQKEIEQYGCKLRKYTKPNGLASTYFVYYSNSTCSKPNPFTHVLKLENLWGQKLESKHVPNKYKLGDTTQRLEVLAGLMDSDGHHSRGGFDFISKSKQLSEDVVFLSRSVGLSANISKCIKSCQNNFSASYYRVCISGDCSIIPTRINRQKAIKRRQIKNNLKTGFKIEFHEYGEYFGFTLDKNHLYMTSDFFVHHNSGKSVLIGALIHRIMQTYPNQRILMITHVKELIEQNYQKLITIWPDAPIGIYSAGIGKKQPWTDIVYGGIQSMYKQANKLGHRDIILIDEVHLLNPSQTGMYMQFINDLKKINPHLKVVGFSATPWRLKGGSLLHQKNAILTDIIYEIGIKELVDKGYLSPLIGKSSAVQANMTGVKITAGEFNLKQAENAIDKEELTKAALDEIEVLAKDRKHFLFFCTGIQHSKHIKDALRTRGWDAEVITCNTPKNERTALLQRFKQSKSRMALINNAVLTTGVDLPNIDCIILLRATASSVLYIQMLGRGMRLSESKKNCLCLDFAGNIERFGAIDLISAPRYKNKKDDGKPTSPPQKICPNCRESILIAINECHCGYIFPESEKPQHDMTASTAAIMSHEIKPIKHEVTEVKYASHTGPSGIPTMRVSYYDMMGIICSEYICFQHTGYPRKKAEAWFNIMKNKKRLFPEPPGSIERAIEWAEWHAFKQPIAIYTKKNGKNTEITGYEF